MKPTATKLRARAKGHLGRGLSRSPSPAKNVPGLVHFFVGRATGGAAIPDIPLASQVKALEAGLPQTELTDLQDSLALTNDRLISLVGLSKSTFHRYKSTSTHLDPLVSDRVVCFALLLSKAIKVFGSQEDAKKWLMSPQFGLGGEVPLDYAKTEVGAREVENLLGRGEYG